MKVAVTGATGFIGRHVLAQLVERDVEVIAVVRPMSSRAASLKARVVELDLHDAAPDVFDRMGGPDVLIHLAWAGLPNYRSLHHFESELPAQYRFLKGLIAGGLSKLLVAGTCFEYGMQSGALSVSDQPRPTNPYGFAKDSLRRELQFLQNQHSFVLTWARLFYLYGEGQPETSLFPQLKRAVENGETVFNMSGGEQLRDYLHVTDAAKQIVDLALESQESRILNVCSGQPISVRRLVERWVKENQWSISLNLGHYPYPDYEPMAFWGQQ